MASGKAHTLLAQRFFDDDPADAARKLDGLETGEAVSILEGLSDRSLAAAFPFLHHETVALLLERLPSDRFAEVAERLDLQQCASAFGLLDEEGKAKLVNSLPEKKRSELRELLEFPENSAGRIMKTDFIAFHPHLTIREAAKKLRAAAKKTTAPSYVYIVDTDRRLQGVITIRDLLIHPGGTPLEKIVKTDVLSVDAFMDREEVANILAARKYFAAPVVDSDNRLLGVVRAQQLISEVQEEGSEDILKMFGAGANERSFSPISFSLGKRLPWLHVNLATAFLAAAVVGLFEDTIARITVLAVFLPVVAGQGGNAGAQSLAVVMRGIVMREIPKDRIFSLIWKESIIGIINGCTIGLVTAAIAWWWSGNPFLGVVIGLAMIVNLFAAGFSGAAIPVGMKAIGLDPAQSSSIILTTVTDVVGFFTFLSFAVLFQSYLL